MDDKTKQYHLICPLFPAIRGILIHPHLEMSGNLHFSHKMQTQSSKNDHKKREENRLIDFLLFEKLIGAAARREAKLIFASWADDVCLGKSYCNTKQGPGTSGQEAC